MPKLLVIDDESSIRFSIGHVFQSEGMQVLCAPNALEGLHLAERESPDVVLLDLKLGQDSGMDLFEQLRALKPRPSVIFITGFGTSETQKMAKKLGAFEFLLKPLDLIELRHVVTRAIANAKKLQKPVDA